jgi:hypothetical protein
LYPEGQEPIFSIANFALEPGLQYSPELLYPEGQEPLLGTVVAVGSAKASVLNNISILASNVL